MIDSAKFVVGLYWIGSLFICLSKNRYFSLKIVKYGKIVVFYFVLLVNEALIVWLKICD